MNELYLIKSGDNGFVEETSAVISADSGEISINDSLYVESAGNIGIGSSNPVNKLDVVGSASISSDLTVQGITFTNVGGNSPSAVNDIIKYDGNNWVVAASTTLPGGGGGGAGSSDVPAGLIDTLTQGESIHEVTFGYDSNNDRIVYDNVPKIAASLEIDGAGEIIPHTVSGVSESGYFVVFSEELPTANYRMHTVFGGTDAFWETGVANLEYSERNVEIDRSLYVGQKVGIGTTNPSEGLLHLSQTDNDAIKIERTDSGSNNASIYIGHSAGGLGISTSGRIGVTNPDFFISSTGNVGIGTTSPSAKLSIVPSTDNVFALEVSNSSGTQRGGLFINSDNGSALYLKDNSSNTDILLDTTGPSYIMGDVGIGTTSPTSALEVIGTDPNDNISRVVNIRDARSYAADVGGGISLFGKYNSSGSYSTFAQILGAKTSGTDGDYSGYLVFKTRSASALPAERMRIDSSGNVGIGTTGPSARLTLPAGQAIHFDDSSAITKAAINSGAGGTLELQGDLDLRFKTTNEAMRIDSNGNVGIGTTNPSQKLDVRGSINLRSGYNLTWDGNGIIASDALKMVFYVAGGEIMRINSAGNVGIGTTNPGSYKLNVNGTARVSSGDVTSDDRVKHNEQPIVGALETLSKITPKKYIKTTEMYDANHDFELDAGGNPIDENGESVEHRIEAGVIAQQVLTVDELAFAVSPEGVDEDGKVTSPHGLDYNSLFTYAIAAIQEQQTMIEDLKKEIEQLKS